MADWLTRAHLSVHMRVEFAPVDAAAADQAVAAAAATIESYCGRRFAATDPWIDAVRNIALRIAVDIFNNPLDRQSYSGPEGLAFTPRPRLLTSDEERVLDRLRPRQHPMGTARLAVAPWMGA